MDSEQIKWQLPVKQSNKTNHDWVDPRANFHAFVGYKSLCSKYFQDTDFFETDMPEGTDQKHMCKICKKLITEQSENTAVYHATGGEGMICPVCKEERDERHLQVGDDQCEFCMMSDVEYSTGEGHEDSPSDDWAQA